MEIEKQVCSLELAQKLKELNVKQQSLVYWLKIQYSVTMKSNPDGTIFEDENGFTVIDPDKTEYEYRLGSPFAWNSKPEDTWSAFTVAELGILLPETWRDEMIRFDRHEGAFEAEIMDDLFYISESNEADARAKTLIFLLRTQNDVV